MKLIHTSTAAVEGQLELNDGAHILDAALARFDLADIPEDMLMG